MVRAYHFLSEDLRSDEDMIAGNSVPWRIAETRAFTPAAIDAGNEEIVSEIGYRSSPTLWDAFLQADGPVACLVEVSEVLSVEGDVDAGLLQLSGTRRLLMAREIGAELRSFASDCAERVLYLYEREFPGDDRPRGAIQVTRDFARGRVGATELRAALVPAKIAVDASPCGSAARCAALSAWGGVVEAAQDAAAVAMWAASWAADGRDAADGAERAWQRALFSRTIERVIDK
jgi:hypothetical protein